MEPQSQLLKINKNEYLAQQKSKLEDALEMGLTKDEYNLICKKIDKTPNMTEHLPECFRMFPSNRKGTNAPRADTTDGTMLWLF